MQVFIIETEEPHTRGRYVVAKEHLNELKAYLSGASRVFGQISGAFEVSEEFLDQCFGQQSRPAGADFGYWDDVHDV